MASEALLATRGRQGHPPAGPSTPVYAINPEAVAILRNFRAGSGTPVKPAKGPRGLYATAASTVVRFDLATGHIAARAGSGYRHLVHRDINPAMKLVGLVAR
jgi:hypothetical protein